MWKFWAGEIRGSIVRFADVRLEPAEVEEGD